MWRFITPKDDRLLGRANDLEIAKRHGRDQSLVQKGRMKLGIPSTKRGWSAEEIAQLGGELDSVLARRFGRTEKAILSKRLALHSPILEAQRRADE